MAQIKKNEEFKYSSVAKSEGEAKLHEVGRVELTFKKEEFEPSSRLFLYIAACTANLSAFSCGICLGWTSPVIPKLQNANLTSLDSAITDSEAGWIGSLLPLGAVLGPFIACAGADRIGRKRTLLTGCTPFIIGFILNLVTTNVYYLFVSRFICGISAGITFTVLPMYIGEIAEDEVRGALGTLLQLFTVMGLLFSYAIGPYLSVTYFNASCIVVPVIFLVTYYVFVPESPYFLLLKGEDVEAEKALMNLRNRDSPLGVRTELTLMKQSVNESLANKASFMDIFRSKRLTKAFLLSNGLLIFQQVSGINVVLFFAQSIFQDAGVALPPEICTITIGIVQVLASGAASLLIDSQGKRPLLMISAVGMALSQGALAYFFFLKDDKHADISNISWLPIVCLIGYIITYCLGFGPIPWAVMGEMFPANVKSVASTVTAATCWFFGFIITKYFASVAQMIGKSGSFGIFGGCCIVALLFVFKFLPETSGKSLQEIQDILNGNKSIKDDED